MYDILIAYHTLELIQESLEKIHLRFSDISCPDDFLLSESGMMRSIVFARRISYLCIR